MALFGRKKKDEEKGAKSSENKQSNSVTEEMKVILEAREEEQKEKLAKAEERQQAQEEQAKQESFLEEQSKQAAKKILEGDGIPEGMTFFVVCDEIPLSAEPETRKYSFIREEATSLPLRSRRSETRTGNSLTRSPTTELRSRSQEAIFRFRRIRTITLQVLSRDLLSLLTARALKT